MNVVLSCMFVAAMMIAMLTVAASAQPIVNKYLKTEHATVVGGGELRHEFTSTYTAEQCASFCYYNISGCVSFNYYAGNSTCHFNGYNQKYTVVPAHNSDYWLKKLEVNNKPSKQYIPYQLEVPTSGITLSYGILHAVMEANMNYLSLFPLEDLLYFYRIRAGNSTEGGQCWGWDQNLRGSISGLYMMGAGNSLRWMQNSTEQKKLDSLVSEIAKLKTSEGFIMAYPENFTKVTENPNYVQSWVTHGLWDTYVQGNPLALSLARSQLNWYNTNPYIPEYLPPNTDPATKPGQYGDYEGHGIYIQYQGMIHNSIMALSSVGNQGDVDLLTDLYQENDWLRGLIARDVRAVWQRTWFSHNYELTGIEAYLDLYLLTGNSTYLNAVYGAWDLFYAHWIHVGGSIAINEGPPYPPNSYFLSGGRPLSGPHRSSMASQGPAPCGGPSLSNDQSHEHNHYKGEAGDGPYNTGETCGTVFWTKLNQRLHRLFPKNETYVTEIERSIYNVGVANQNPVDGGNRYFTLLHRYKDMPSIVGTCCEGQGTRFRGSFPEYIYSTSKTGIMIDLFVPSTFSLKIKDVDVVVAINTLFPYGNKVMINVQTNSPVNFTIDVRIPSWAAAAYPISVNNINVATGKAGSYVSLTQTWSKTNVIAFEIPMAFQAHKYTGSTQIGSYTRFAYTYGPILMASVGPWNSGLDCIVIPGKVNATNPGEWMVPVPEKPLHFSVRSDSSYLFVPYFELQNNQIFTAYPILY